MGLTIIIGSRFARASEVVSPPGFVIMHSDASISSLTLSVKPKLMHCFFVFNALKALKGYSFRFIISAFVAECVMVLGYFLFEGVLYGFATSAVNIPFNLVQGGLSLVIANVVVNILYANKTVRKFMAFASNKDLLNQLMLDVKSESKIVCVFFSNGSFDNIHKDFATKISKDVH